MCNHVFWCNLCQKPCRHLGYRQLKEQRHKLECWQLTCQFPTWRSPVLCSFDRDNSNMNPHTWLTNRNTGSRCCSVRCSSMLKLLCILIHSLDFQKCQFFNGQKGQAGGTASLCQILSKSLQPRPRYGDFSISQDGRRHVGFLKFQIFNNRKGQEGRSASLCQI